MLATLPSPRRLLAAGLPLAAVLGRGLCGAAASAHEPEEVLAIDTFTVQDAHIRPVFVTNSTLGDAEEEAPGQGREKIADVEVDGERWSVHEDLAQRNGHIVFRHASGKETVFPKAAEASYFKEHAKYPRNLGIAMSKIGMDLPDVLADALLRDGEPIEEKVAAIIPPLGSRSQRNSGAAAWTSFVGNVHTNDNAPIFGYGNTRSYQPSQKFPIRASKQRSDGFVGGWMPAVRKVHPISESEFQELITFADVDDPNPFVVKTWHRTAQIRNGKITRVLYGTSYPNFGPFHKEPKPEEFYAALLRFGRYWEKHLADFAPLSLPDRSWTDMTKYAFAMELMVRPGGEQPKYGAVDRDYYGLEYDGFQDVFTSSLAANLEWGRFKMARTVLDNYFTLHVDQHGGVNMRGPETAQFGMTLSLLTKYARYTGDVELLAKHKAKILATARGLLKMHDDSLALPESSPGHGLIHGWSESDACLKGNPDLYWKPYFANNAFTARGLRDLSSLAMFAGESAEWRRRSEQMLKQLETSMRRSMLRKSPPYMPPLPGTNQTFREAMSPRASSEQDWPHRLYAELLHAAVLPADLANLVHDTMRGYGATSLGVVANVGVPGPYTRDLLGFISYGHAYSLLLLDRVDEFVLFLYSHRYHVHTRGTWRAAEVSGLNGDLGTFCIPAQLTIPAIVRWALVLEHPDEDLLYAGRGVPRDWVASGREISVRRAPTRWGPVDYETRLSAGVARTVVRFHGGVPKEVEVKLRAPRRQRVAGVTVNGRPAALQKNEAVLVAPEGAKEIVVEWRLT
jgi:hypothetical protein